MTCSCHNIVAVIIAIGSAVGSQVVDMMHPEKPLVEDVTIMLEAAYPPFNDFDPVKGLVGFDVELIPLVCEAAGITCSVVTAPFKTAWPGHELGFMGDGFLNHGFDCVAASGNTMPRRSTLKFSDPYTQEVLGAFVANKGVKMAEDASDTHIGTVEGFSCGKSYLLRTMPNVGNVTEFSNAKALFEALASDEVQVALTCPLANANKAMNSTKHEIIKQVSGFNDGLGFMCHPEAENKIHELNKGLAEIRKNGKLKKLCAKYPSVKCEFERRFDSNAGGIDDEAEKADLTIMMEAAYPPFNNFDPVKGLVGFDVELVPLVCEQAGISCAVVTAPFKTAWPGHEKAFMGEGFLNHHFDCVSGSGATMPRRATLKFSELYTKEVLAAFVANKGVKMAEDGSDVTVGAVEGFSCGSAYLARTMPKMTNVTEFESQEALFEALSEDTVQVALTCPLASAKKAMDAEKHEIIKTMGGFNDGLGFMCHPDLMSEKLDLLNKGMRKVRASSDFKQLCKKYPDVKCEFSQGQGASDDADEADDEDANKTKVDRKKSLRIKKSGAVPASVLSGVVLALLAFAY